MQPPLSTGKVQPARTGPPLHFAHQTDARGKALRGAWRKTKRPGRQTLFVSPLWHVWLACTTSHKGGHCCRSSRPIRRSRRATTSGAGAAGGRPPFELFEDCRSSVGFFVFVAGKR